MKTVMQNSQRINLLQFLALVLAIGLLSGCNKEEEQQVTTVSEEDAVEVVENALKVESEGLTAEVEDAAQVADEYAEKTEVPCGETFDSTAVYSLTNTYITADYTSSWSWTLSCNQQNIPTTLDFTRTTEGDYETTRMVSDDSATGAWTLDNLLLGDAYTINGSYVRTGSQESKVRNMTTFSSTVEFALADVNVDKDLYRITDGTATFTISGTGSGGRSFQYTGEIIFLGDGAATITINGNTYSVDLY